MTEPKTSHQHGGDSCASADSSVDLSVAIVTYNSADHIAACLTSLVADVRDLRTQFALVDNASSDSTVEVVEKVADAQADGRHSFSIRKNGENVGFTRALNQALECCHGDFVLVLNPDTEIVSPCLPVLLQALRQDESIGVAAPQLRNPNGSIQKSCRRFPRRRDVLLELSALSGLFPGSPRFNRWKMGGFEHRARAFVEQPQGAFLLFRRKLLQKTGPWDERFPMFFSDVDWCLRVRRLGYRILFEPAARALHHKGASIYRERARMIKSSHRSFYNYFQKHSRNILFVNEFLGLILWVTAAVRVGLLYLTGCLKKFRGKAIISGAP